MNTSIGHVGRQAGGADSLGEPHAAEDFHGAGVAALHLGQQLRRLLRSISVQRTPRRPRSIASVSPTGPAPTINTSVSIQALSYGGKARYCDGARHSTAHWAGQP